MRDWIAGLVLILTSPVWAAEPIVSDGDTLTVDGTKYRLDGIDAPEFNQVCLDEKGQEWNCGLAARDALAKLIANRAVQCEDKGPDKVHRDRRIGICTFESIELNKWLVREGWAVNFEPYAKGRFLRDQADAAKNRRGVWKGCFAAPTDWRHWKKDAPLMGSACPSDAASRIFDCRIKGNQRSGKYHHPGCPSYDSISAKNVAKQFCSEDEARATRKRGIARRERRGHKMKASISVAIAGLLCFNTYASAQPNSQSRNGAYYCVEEAAGGLSHDAMTKKWKGSAFRPNAKFVLRLQHRGRRETKEEFGNETIDDYQVTITESGTSKGDLCVVTSREEKRLLVGVYYSSGWMEECQAGLRHYIFNLKKGRFLSIYAIGYVNGIDASGDTPVISGGTCTKID